jgi:hypothetical protein
VRGETGYHRVKRSLKAHLFAYAPQQQLQQQADATSRDPEQQQSNDRDDGDGVAVNMGSKAMRSAAGGASHYTSDKLMASSRDHRMDHQEAGKAMELVPHNLSIVLVKWYPQPAIRVSWSFDSSSTVSCEAFQVMYHSENSKFRYIIEVPCHVRNVTIERLLPATEYILTVNVIPSPADHQHDRHHYQGSRISVNAVPSGSIPSVVPLTSSSSPIGSNKFMTKETQQQQSMSSLSGPNVIRFVSPQVEYTRANKWKSLVIRSDGASVPGSGADGEIVKSGELAVVIFVLSGWIFMIIVFVRKWGRIRGIETVSTYSNVTANAAVVAASAFTSQVSPTSAAAGTMFAYPPIGSTGVTMGSTAGSILRSQKSKESDESSGSHPGDRVNMHASASIRKKRLEDAIHQFMLLKNQQSIGQMRSGYGIYDQILVGRRGIRSMEGHRPSRRQRRRGSLEDRSKIRSEGDLNQDVRMNRSAENLLRLDFT